MQIDVGSLLLQLLGFPRFSCIVAPSSVLNIEWKEKESGRDLILFAIRKLLEYGFIF